MHKMDSEKMEHEFALFWQDNTEVYFVWALHSSVDATDSSIYPFHERKGSSGSKHLIVPADVSSTHLETSIEIILPSTTSSATTMSTTSSSYDSETHTLPYLANNFGFKPTPLSSLTSSIVQCPLERPSEIQSNSVSQTDLSQKSSVNNQLSATTALSPSSSNNTSLDSTSSQKSTIPSSGADHEKGTKQDSRPRQEEGEVLETNFVFLRNTFLCDLYGSGICKNIHMYPRR